ncbi:unnamed protein product [Bursaphelenchus okinawaensis]|uniref:Bromo domain-containing protein n=1 Tax=Bursaphelenchus okinawaensis TaxID=465554 RepID=A0A811JTV2_9BILA|nr:unnamed protein product [Bursaphelenchus okinawaensis]CAG9082936.1 unnamed protein product [Bursaphelenchus okinawaensis]
MSDDKRRSTKGRKRAPEEEASIESSHSESELETVETDGRKRKKKRKSEVVPKKRKIDKKESPDLQGSPKKEKEDEEEVKKVNVRDYTPFQLFCDFILRRVMEKDVEEFFLYPVSAEDAPDYATIISTPMDFTTVRKKIDSNAYNHINELKNDFMLVTSNAMTYNNPNTVYYIAASKLQNCIRYYFSPGYREYVKYSLPFGAGVAHDQIGLVPKVPLKLPMKRNERTMAIRKAVIDNVSTKDVMSAAAPAVRSRLAEERPPWPMGYIDKKDSGTVLNIVGSGQTKVSMSDFVGKLEKGASYFLPEYSPLESADSIVNYTSYGPFCSFAPQYDSTWSSLNKRDSDLLLSCYGDKNNTSDAVSLRQMALDAGGCLVKAVDGILDILTDGEHSKTLKELNSEVTEEEAKKEAETQAEETLAEISKLGADSTYIDELKKELGLAAPEGSCEHMLNVAGELLRELNNVQTNRLNQDPPVSLNDLGRPDQAEGDLAVNVAQQFTNIVKHGAAPKDLVTTPQIHQAIGVSADDFDYDVLSEFITLPT